MGDGLVDRAVRTEDDHVMAVAAFDLDSSRRCVGGRARCRGHRSQRWERASACVHLAATGPVREATDRIHPVLPEPGRKSRASHRCVNPFDDLAGQVRYQFEVFVQMQDCSPSELGRRGNEEIGNRGCTVLAAVSEESLHLDGTILNDWGQVLNRHRSQWRRSEAADEVRCRAGRVADLEAGDGRDGDHAALNAGRPLGGGGARCEADQGRLVNQPGRGHAQAPFITDSSPRTSASWARSATVTSVSGIRWAA